MSDIDMVAGARLRKLRYLSGMSQKALAAVLGIHRPSMAMIETGKQRLTLEQLLLACAHFGVPPCYLLGFGTFLGNGWERGCPHECNPALSHGV